MSILSFRTDILIDNNLYGMSIQGFRADILIENNLFGMSIQASVQISSLIIIYLACQFRATILKSSFRLLTGSGEVVVVVPSSSSTSHVNKLM